MKQRHRPEQLEKTIQKYNRQMNFLEKLLTIMNDTVHVISFIFIIGMIGGAEAGSVQEWRIYPIIILTVIVNLALVAIKRSIE